MNFSMSSALSGMSSSNSSTAVFLTRDWALTITGVLLGLLLAASRQKK